jgi:hypothetical protein
MHAQVDKRRSRRLFRGGCRFCSNIHNVRAHHIAIHLLCEEALFYRARAYTEL